jgi:hypothetical protein
MNCEVATRFESARRVNRCSHLRPRKRRVDPDAGDLHADGRFTRLEGAPCDEYAAALAVS